MTKTEISVAVLQGNQSGKDWNLEININVWENLNDKDLEQIAEAIYNGEVDGDDPCMWTLLVSPSIQEAWDHQLVIEEKKEYLVTIVTSEAAIPLGHYSKEVAESMKKEIQWQIDTAISQHVQKVMVH